MSGETSVPLLLLTTYIWVLLLGGLIALIIDFRADAKGDRMSLPSWNLGWVDFALGFWLLIFASFAAQSLVLQLLSLLGVPPDNTSISALAMGIAFHGTALVLIVIALKRPNLDIHFKLSPVRMRPGNVFKVTCLFFFSGTFLALLSSKVWTTFLLMLESHGLAPIIEPQELVTIFAESGIGIIPAMLVLLAVVVAPITEELIFRAGIYRFLKGRFTARFALIFSSLFFAFMHFNLVSFIPLFLLGMLLCRSYERTGNILIPIIFHAFFNANTILLLLFQSEAGPILEEMAINTLHFTKYFGLIGFMI